MLLSHACQYGIRSAVFLALQPDAGYVPVRAISSTLDISHHFLAKVLQQLIAPGILKSYRGPNGGVALAKPASEVTVRDLVEAIDGPDVFDRCILGLPECGSGKPCPLHAEWGSVRSDFGAKLSRTSILALAERMTAEGHGLSEKLPFLAPNTRQQTPKSTITS